MAGLFSKATIASKRQSVRFPAGANVAQAFGYDTQAWPRKLQFYDSSCRQDTCWAED
jgi:hypothetical protein